MAFSMWVNGCGYFVVCPGFIPASYTVVNVSYLIDVFLLLSIEKKVVSVAYLNKFVDLWCSVTENSSSEVVDQISCFLLPEDGSTVGFRNLVLHYRRDAGRSPEK
jgi:hypothetical protein